MRKFYIIMVLLFSSVAIAEPLNSNSRTTAQTYSLQIETSLYKNKSDVYNEIESKINELNNMSSSELSKKYKRNLVSPNGVKKLHIEGELYAEVSERIKDGEIYYVGFIKGQLHYLA
ncbi:hypothetical protein [Vibrio paucivorans]|uniref:DUF3316 domain-containing protein n=1 Tax=Vibrio paucivorans TaxID=2829489 RepID=A0A9X3CEV7_9VIBR|nr:hypothetical protein [Vibrio paucivorans]MCW8333635.1 hypothetical protein [Vibrio paucivorans]